MEAARTSPETASLSDGKELDGLVGSTVRRNYLPDSEELNGTCIICFRRTTVIEEPEFSTLLTRQHATEHDSKKVLSIAIPKINIHHIFLPAPFRIAPKLGLQVRQRIELSLNAEKIII